MESLSDIILPRDPDSDMKAATKRYVDAHAGSGGGEVYVGLSSTSPSPGLYSQWVVTDDPAAYVLRVSDGSAWYPIAGGGGGGGASNVSPTASFTYTTHWSTVNVTGLASSDPDGYIASYEWDWGDGSAHSTGPTASHTFETSGAYNVFLTVKDDLGRPNQTYQTISVTRMYGPIVMTTVGSTFTPKLWQTSGSTNAIEWINAANSTVLGTGITPTINYGSAANRTVHMYCSRPQDILTFNVGYKTAHDPGNYGPGTSGGAPTADREEYDLNCQRVTSISGLQIMTNLVNFMGAGDAYGTIPYVERLQGTVDFSNLSKLEYIECCYSRVSGVNLTGCSSLIRLGLEENNFQGNTVDLNPVRTTLKDIRMAFQGGVTFAPLTGPMTQLYHYCIRDQPVTNPFKYPNLPALQEYWVWNIGQGGVMVVPPNVMDMRVQYNPVTSIDLTNTPSAPSPGSFNAAFCTSLTSIVGMSGGRQFDTVLVDSCGLSTALVDSILASINSWGRSNGTINISGNSAPTGGSSNTSVVALRARGYSVNIG
jgi:PKD repeat protein